MLWRGTPIRDHLPRSRFVGVAWIFSPLRDTSSKWTHYLPPYLCRLNTVLQKHPLRTFWAENRKRYQNRVANPEKVHVRQAPLNPSGHVTGTVHELVYRDRIFFFDVVAGTVYKSRTNDVTLKVEDILVPASWGKNSNQLNVMPHVAGTKVCPRVQSWHVTGENCPCFRSLKYVP